MVDFVLFGGPLVSLKADEMSNYLVILVLRSSGESNLQAEQSLAAL